MAIQINRARIILNPASRRGGRSLLRIERALTARGVAFDVVSTAAPGDAACHAIARPSACDAVFVVGGDGTATEVLGALAGSETPVGILPAGTGNLLARALGIPLDPARAAGLLCQGSTRRIDLAQLADGRHFAVAAGMGIDVEMLARTSSMLKRRLGVGAYLLSGGRAAIGAAMRGDRFTARITVDGVAHEVSALTVLVANMGTVLDGRITLAPGSRPDDGLLDVCVCAPCNVGQAVRVAMRAWRGRFPDDGLTHFFRGAHVRVEAEPQQRVEADGELLDLHVIDTRVKPLAGVVLVPPGE